MVSRKSGLPLRVFVEKCAGCLTCELRCSLRFEKAFLPAAAAIQVLRKGNGNFGIAFTPRCDNCGICARYCPYGALAQKKKEGE